MITAAFLLQSNKNVNRCQASVNITNTVVLPQKRSPCLGSPFLYLLRQLDCDQNGPKSFNLPPCAMASATALHCCATISRAATINSIMLIVLYGGFSFSNPTGERERCIFSGRFRARPITRVWPSLLRWPNPCTFFGCLCPISCRNNTMPTR